MVGRPLSFQAEEGCVFASPVASPAMFSKEMGGGGVLLDTGPHMLDNLLWWFGDYESVSYWDDCFGGVEADCLLDLKFKSGLQGTVKYSRLRNLSNSVKVDCERGVVEVPVGQSEEISIKINGHNYTSFRRKTGQYREGNVGYLMKEIEYFAQLIRIRTIFITGEAAKPVNLLEE